MGPFCSCQDFLGTVLSGIFSPNDMGLTLEVFVDGKYWRADGFYEDVFCQEANIIDDYWTHRTLILIPVRKIWLDSSCSHWRFDYRTIWGIIWRWDEFWRGFENDDWIRSVSRMNWWIEDGWGTVWEWMTIGQVLVGNAIWWLHGHRERIVY